MVETLLQSENKKHEGQRDDESHCLSPLKHDLGRRHREMFDLGSFGQSDVRRPVLLLNQLLDIAHAVGYHVVEHERVQTGQPLLRQQHLVGQHQEYYLIRHNGEVAHLQEEILRAIHRRVKSFQETIQRMPSFLGCAFGSNIATISIIKNIILFYASNFLQVKEHQFKDPEDDSKIYCTMRH